MANRSGGRRNQRTRGKSKQLEEANPQGQQLDLWCDLCHYNSEKKIIAHTFCNECNCFLCRACTRTHEKDVVFGNHSLLVGEIMPKTRTEGNVKYSDCNTHNGFVNDIFCLDHSKMICSQCVREYHHRCKSNFIPLFCKELGHADVKNLQDVISYVRQNVSCTKTRLENNITDIEEYRIAMTKEAENSRDEMIKKINDRYSDTINNINEICRSKCSDIVGKVSTLSNMIDALDETKLDIEKSEDVCIGPGMFIKLQDVVQDIRKCTRKLNKQFKRSTLTFSPAKEISTFFSTCKQLGDVAGTESDIETPNNIFDIGFPQPPDLEAVVSRKRKRRDIANIQATKMTDLSARAPDDSNACNIAGMAITATGSILILDNGNGVIKVLSPDNQLLSTFVLPKPAKFNVVTVINDNKAAVYVTEQDGNLFYNDKYLHMLDISDESSISVEKSQYYPCLIVGLAAFNNNLAISWWSPYESVQMVDLNGEEMWKIKASYNSHFFRTPGTLAIQTLEDKQAVVVTDWAKATLTSVDANSGDMIKQTGVKINELSFLTTDDDGNVYCYMRGANEIRVWSADLQESRVFLSGKELDMVPTAIVYSGITDELYISYQNSNIIGRFQL